MKFWIEKNGFIYLFQILKAAGIEDDYQKIEFLIRDGRVSVNGETSFKQRHILKNGDIVQYRDKHIKVLDKTASGEKPAKYTEGKPYKGAVKHGRTKTWKPHPVNENLQIDQEIEKNGRFLHNFLREHKLTISIAESCTGGMLQEIITKKAGSSQYFLGGFVVYSEMAKRQILRVPEEELQRYGAVSREIAEIMTEKCQELLRTDISCAITGLAGPEGDERGNPVGTVHIAVKSGEEIHHRVEHFSGDRVLIRKKSCAASLQLLKNKIKKYLTNK